MPTARAARQDMAVCTLTVDGRPAPFSFKARSGGDTTIEGSKTRLGGMGGQVALGGPSGTENLTLTADLEYAAHIDFAKWLRSRSGVGEASVSEALLDRDGNVFRKGDTWTGIVGGVNLGEYDADSGDPRTIEVEIETDGTVA